MVNTTPANMDYSFYFKEGDKVFESVRENHPDKVLGESDEIFLYEEGSILDGDGNIVDDLSKHYAIMLIENEKKVGEIIFTTYINSVCGNVSYRVFPEYQGNKYALKALKLLKENIYKISKDDLYIATHRDNKASIKTATMAGALFLEKVRIPKSYNFSENGKYKYANMYIIRNKGGKEI